MTTAHNGTPRLWLGCFTGLVRIMGSPGPSPVSLCEAQKKQRRAECLGSGSARGELAATSQGLRAPSATRGVLERPWADFRCQRLVARSHKGKGGSQWPLTCTPRVSRGQPRFGCGVLSLRHSLHCGGIAGTPRTGLRRRVPVLGVPA